MTTLILRPGDDFTYTASVTDEDEEPFDLTGCTLWFTVKRRLSDADEDAMAALYWTSEDADGITVSDEASGVAEIAIDADATAEFTQAAHRWDLQIEDTGPKKRTVDSGILVVMPAVTMRTTTP